MKRNNDATNEVKRRTKRNEIDNREKLSILWNPKTTREDVRPPIDRPKSHEQPHSKHTFNTNAMSNRMNEEICEKTKMEKSKE